MYIKLSMHFNITFLQKKNDNIYNKHNLGLIIEEYILILRSI